MLRKRRKIVLVVVSLILLANESAYAESVETRSAPNAAIAEYKSERIQWKLLFSPGGKPVSFREKLELDVQRSGDVQILIGAVNLTDPSQTVSKIRVEAETPSRSRVGEKRVYGRDESGSSDAARRLGLSPFPPIQVVDDALEKGRQAAAQRRQGVVQSEAGLYHNLRSERDRADVELKEYLQKLRKSENVGEIFEDGSGKQGLRALTVVNPSSVGTWKVSIESNNSDESFAVVALAIPIELTDADEAELQQVTKDISNQIQGAFPNYALWSLCDSCCQCKAVALTVGVVTTIVAIASGGTMAMGAAAGTWYAFAGAMGVKALAGAGFVAVSAAVGKDPWCVVKNISKVLCDCVDPFRKDEFCASPCDIPQADPDEPDDPAPDPWFTPISEPLPFKTGDKIRLLADDKTYLQRFCCVDGHQTLLAWDERRSIFNTFEVQVVSDNKFRLNADNDNDIARYCCINGESVFTMDRAGSVGKYSLFQVGHGITSDGKAAITLKADGGQHKYLQRVSRGERSYIEAIGDTPGKHTTFEYEIILPAPVITQVPHRAHPPIPSGLKATCLGVDSSICPVLKWDGYTYWAYSHIDNRYGMTIVAYDVHSKAVQSWEQRGARYISHITFDAANSTVTFVGQSHKTIVMKLGTLRVSRTPLPDHDATHRVELSCNEISDTTASTRKIRAKVGETVLVKLCSNATTGYSWTEPVLSDPQVVTLESSKLIAPQSELAGAPGARRWVFRAKSAGGAELSSTYRRPRVRDPNASKFILKIEVER